MASRSGGGTWGWPPRRVGTPAFRLWKAFGFDAKPTTNPKCLINHVVRASSSFEARCLLEGAQGARERRGRASTSKPWNGGTAAAAAVWHHSTPPKRIWLVGTSMVVTSPLSTLSWWLLNWWLLGWLLLNCTCSPSFSAQTRQQLVRIGCRHRHHHPRTVCTYTAVL